MVFTGAIEDYRADKKKNRGYDWSMGFHEGRLSAAKFILQYGLTKQNRRVVGNYIRELLQPKAHNS